jgi:hypothetical protein
MTGTDLRKSGYYQFKAKKEKRKRISFFGCLGIVMALLILIPAGIFITSRALQRKQNIRYKPSDVPIANPLMGWAPWATIGECSQPHTLVYADLTWREFEPQEGIFDLQSFEDKQQFTRWRSEGKRVVFRFLLDKPGDEDHLDIPDWLYEKIEGQGDHYNNEYGKGFSPDYSNPILIDYHRRAIQKLGEIYDNDSFFAYIELGSLGHWGEWHVNTWEGIRPLPDEPTRNLYVSHYLESFPSTHLLMRRPFNAAKQNNLGLFNDMSGDLGATTTWLDWIANGGEFNQTEEANGLTPMPDGWKLAPIGGEQSPSLSNSYLYKDQLEQTIDLLARSHTTFIGPGTPCREPSDSLLQPGFDRTINTIGYKIWVTEATLPLTVLAGRDTTASFTLQNNGIAPIYYNWPTKVYVLDNDEKIVNSAVIDITLPMIMPDTAITVTTEIHTSTLPSGDYSLGIAIVDPANGEPAVHLAMENQREDLIFHLGEFQVKDRFSTLVSNLFSAKFEE